MAILKYLRVGDTAELQDNGVRWIRIPSHVASGKQSGVIFESEDGTPVYTWFSDAHAMYYKVSEPTTDTDGTVIGDSATGVTSTNAYGTDNILIMSDGVVRGTQLTGVGLHATTYTMTLPDGASLNLQEDITFGGATTVNHIKFPDSLADALAFENASAVQYLKFDTSSAKAVFGVDLTTTEDIVIGNGKTIGSAGAASAITIASGGGLTLAADLTCSEDIVIGDGKLIGSDTAKDTITISSAGLATFGYAVTITGAATCSSTLASGALTVTGAVSGSTTITAGTNIISTAGYISLADDQQLRLGDGGSSDSYIQYDSTNDWLEFYDANIGGPYSLAELLSGTPLNPIVVGDLTISDGQFDWNNGTAGDVATWTFASTGTNCIDIVANTQDTGNVIDINADDIGSGAFIHLDTDETSGFNGAYIDCYSGSDVQDFVVKLSGVTTITGVASGTAALTLTAGDVKLSDGGLDVDSTAAAKPVANFTRNYGSGASSQAAVTIKEDYASANQAALHVVSDVTGNYDTIIVDHAGDEAAVLTNVLAAGGDGVEVILASGATGNGVFIDGTTTSGYVGAAAAGMLHLKQSGTMTNSAASALRIDYDGTCAATGEGYCLNIDDNGGAIASSYAVYVHSEDNVPMKLETAGVTKQTLVLEATAAQTASTLLVDGATNDWDGAAATGMIHVSQDAAMDNAGASCLYIAHSGTPITAATGFMAAFVDAGSNQAGVYGVDINSTANHPLRVRTGAVGVNPVTILPHTNATASGLIVDGNTNSWLGAANTGLVQITQLGTFADTAASALFIDVNGDAAAGGEGYALLIDDESDTTGGGEYAVYVNSKAGSPMKLEGQAVGMATLVLESTTAQTAATLLVDGDSNDWKGADNIGAVTIQNDSTAQNAGASLLVLDMNGQGTSGMEGTCFRALDTGGAAAGTSYATEIASTNNNALQISTGSIGKAALTIIPHTNATSSAVVIDGNAKGWGGASNVGMLHLKNDIAGLNANASSLLITKDANTVAEVNDAEGSCLRIVENMNVSASPPAYAMYISCVDNEALHVDSGNVVIDEDLTVGVDTTGTAGHVDIWDGAGGSAPAYIKLASSNGSVTYIFAADNGTLRYHTAIPTSNTDGSAV